LGFKTVEEKGLSNVCSGEGNELSFSFEVRETDLLGRVGTITVGRRKLETPCFLPVVHPVGQAVSIEALREMGFQGLMTNSYIIYKRRKNAALELGVHRLLGFGGVVMTDSGGYQVLEYGSLEVDYSEIADFQSRIGSDLAVTLDRPTGFSSSRKHARETAEYSLRNAVATIRELRGAHTIWLGPVQGGLFLDLLSRSAKALSKAGFEFLALGSPVQVMESYRYSELVKMIVATRRAIPYSMALHLFGAGHPHTMALSVALGCDTFDSASYIIFARDDRYMSERGVARLSEMRYLPCSCPVCVRTSVRELQELEGEERTRRLAIHNLYVLRKEVEACKEAISEGRLWDLVEERAAGHPMVYQAFMELTRHSKILRLGTPAFKDRGLLIRGEADLTRPELAVASAALWGARRRGSREAVLLLSDDSFPLPRIRLERPGSAAPSRDLYRLHPVLGLYPAELDFVYPFTQAVTASGGMKGETSVGAVRRLRRLGYSRVRLGRISRAGRVFWLRPTRTRKSRSASSSPQAA